MPKDMDVNVTTASKSNAQESSWPGNLLSWPGTFSTSRLHHMPGRFVQRCLDGRYIVRASHNLKRETVKHQYQWVKKRTSNFNNYAMGSHVMQYGDTNITDEKLYLYHGFDPATVNLPPHNGKLDTPMEVVNQRDAEILFMWQMYKRFNHQPEKKRDILNQIAETVKHRINHLDGSMELIGVLFYGPGKGSSVLQSVREPGLPLVDDWTCLKSMVRVFETQCGMKHMRAFANICNSGTSEACMAACGGYDAGLLHPSNRGYAA